MKLEKKSIDVMVIVVVKIEEKLMKWTEEPKGTMDVNKHMARGKVERKVNLEEDEGKRS